MKKLLGFLCAILMVLCVAGTVNAMVINGGFEDGDFNGWTAQFPCDGSASVVTSHTGDLGISYDPVEGDYFALLETGMPGSYTTLSQDIYLGEDDVLEGWAAFDYGDYHPYDDNAYVKIYSGSSLIATPWSVFGNSVPNYWDGPWTEWSWIAPSVDTYTLVFGVANDKCGYDSYALFDANVHQSSAAPVPEPSTILLVGTGLIGIIGFGRKRLNKKA